MVPVRLETHDGHFVSDEAMPSFATPPTVLIWGMRVFTYVDAYCDAWGDIGHRYREAFSYYINGMEKNLLASCRPVGVIHAPSPPSQK